jgi:hypothetical protein
MLYIRRAVWHENESGGKALSHRNESILWCGIIVLVMLLFLYLSFDLQFGALYARVTIISSLMLALISLCLSLKQRAEKNVYTEEELSAMSVVDRSHILEAMEEGKIPFFSGDVALVAAVSFGGAFLWESSSFLYVSFASLLFLFLVKKQPLRQGILIAAGTVCIIQYVFGNLFGIPLPSPAWWSIY